MTKTAINWEQVRTQLRASDLALKEALAENPARIQEVFRRRAAQLAQKGEQTVAKAAPIQALIFSVQTENYAIRLEELAEVLPFRECTPVPGAGAEFLGVISRHGELRPVVDVARVIQVPVRSVQTGAPATGGEAQAAGFILMLRKPHRQIGLRVDRVEGLRELAGECFDAQWQGHFASKVAGEALMLLDLGRLLSAIP
jgi:purine-binding chemotaxis protein CheW